MTLKQNPLVMMGEVRRTVEPIRNGAQPSQIDGEIERIPE